MVEVECSQGLYPSQIWFSSSNTNRLLQANLATLISLLQKAFEQVCVILVAGGSRQSVLVHWIFVIPSITCAFSSEVLLISHVDINCPYIYQVLGNYQSEVMKIV